MNEWRENAVRLFFILFVLVFAQCGSFVVLSLSVRACANTLFCASTKLRTALSRSGLGQLVPHTDRSNTRGY